MKRRGQITDDRKESIGHLVEKRVPWLVLGLVGGMAASVIVSKYEDILNQDVRIAFFIPIIVYMSDAIGTQSRLLKNGG